MNGDAFFDLLRARRSTRQFRPEPVADEVVRRLLEAARLAPSAHNRQPWRFVVVGNPEARRRLAEAMADRLRRDRRADGATEDEIEADAARSQDRLLGASCVVVFCLTMEAMDRYPDPRRTRAEHIMAVQSVAMAGQNLLLAAAAEGLGACWLCAPLFAGAEAREALGLPQAWEPQGAVLVGVPKHTPRPRGRRAIDEVTLWR